jgi:hypothetical protein
MRSSFSAVVSALLLALLPALMPSVSAAVENGSTDARVFEGKNLSASKDGETARFSLNTPSRATVMVFLSAKCPCSASHETALGALAKEFHPQGIAFVGIHSNRDETEEEGRSYFKQRLPFPVFRDGSDPSSAPWAESLGALKTPHVFILNPQGEVLYAGGVDDSKDSARAKKHYLREALTAIAAGNPPPQKQTRTLGCAIRRSL